MNFTRLDGLLFQRKIFLRIFSIVSPLHMNLPVENFQRFEQVFTLKRIPTQ